MDLDIDIDDNDTEELRLHIHHLLHDYSRTHYTTNYIDFTENLVSEFVEGLTPIPLTDPYSLVIPPDPYDVFSRMHGISSMAPYDETFKPKAEVRLYLKKIMTSSLGIPKSERVVWDDDYGRDLPLCQPIFVVLSRKSQQSTPNLGSKKPSQSFDLHHRDLLKSQKIKLVPVEEIEDPPLTIDNIKILELQIEDEDRPAVKSLLKSTCKMLSRQEGYKNKYLDPAFLRDDSSAQEYKHHEDFVPIFPRTRMPGSGTPLTTPFSTGLRGFPDLPKVAVGHSDDDISMQNLMVVDGWETFTSQISPPLTPPSTTIDGSDDQIDELMLQSTPNTEPAPIVELFNAQMDVPQFPRSRKIGGNAGIKPHILAGKSLATFLQPLLEKTIETTMQSNEVPVIVQRSSPEPSSLFEQPPSALECPDKEEISLDDDDLDVEIAKLYKGQNLQNLIMDEVIDEKQNFLMEVPDLPEPNVYARKEIVFPTKFSGFLVPPNVDRREGLPHQFLKKTNGKQSLNLALSWVAFTVDKKLPTIAEIVDVTDLFDEPSLTNDSTINKGAPSKVDLAKSSEMILRSVSFADSSPNPVEHLRFLGEESSDYRPPNPDDDFKILLNRSERRRVAKLEGRINDMGASGSDASVVGGGGDAHSVGEEGFHELDDANPRPAKSLSFESRLPVSSQALNIAACGLDSNEKERDLSMNALSNLSHSLPSEALESRSLMELSTEPEITRRRLDIQIFAKLRAKAISSRKETQLPAPVAILLPAEQEDLKPKEAPADIYDSSTIRLPESITMPQSIHKYMASLDVIQKIALVRSLESQECLVDLVERQSLDGVDLILDPHSAIIFLSLFMLSSQCNKYVERVAAQSWKFHRILVVFEAYPQTCARKGNKTLDSDLNAYTPHILKAIRKFRRDLNIAAACGTKCQNTKVLYVFANSVDEGALFARMYGNFVEENDETGGAIWGDRGWLDGDFLEDEEAKLASVDGMNRFSASIVLCQVSLQDFLNIEPEERIARFGGYIGADAVEKFNIDIEHRTKAMEIMCTSE